MYRRTAKNDMERLLSSLEWNVRIFRIKNGIFNEHQNCECQENPIHVQDIKLFRRVT